MYCANRYDDNISLVKSESSTSINRMKWQGEAYRHLMNKYKNNKLMPNLLYRIINKDILEAKFYKKRFINDIDELLPIFSRYYSYDRRTFQSFRLCR